MAPSTTTTPALPLDDDSATDAGRASQLGRTAGAQARARAQACLRAFARTDLPQQEWWSGVGGYFTPAAAPIYRLTDVGNVPVHRIIEGSGVVLPASTRYRAVVGVRTDAGTYTVVLVRAGGQWFVDRLIPPTVTSR